MIEVPEKWRRADLPYTIRFYGVTEAMFDELTDEDTKAELFDGVMIVPSPASPIHDVRAAFIRTLMLCFAEEKKLGEVFGPDTVIHLATCRKFAPDAFFLVQKRVPHPLPEKEFEGAPDLVLEILSPSNRDYDLDDKRPAYREAGVREIWYLDPEQQEMLIDRKQKRKYVTVTTSSGRVTSTVLDGFWLEVDWLWQEPLPTIMSCLRQILA